MKLVLFCFLLNRNIKTKTFVSILGKINCQLTRKCFKFTALGTEYIQPLYYLHIQTADMFGWVSFLPGTDV